MKTQNEIQEWILKNCVDMEGDINLMGLNFEGRNVYLSYMKAKRILQSYHEAEQVNQIGHHAISVQEGDHFRTKRIVLDVTVTQHEAIKKLLEQGK